MVHRLDKYGFNFLEHKGSRLKNITSTPGWENSAKDLKARPSKIAVVPNGMEGRPDLISYSLYGTTSNWWIICVVNDIFDPFEELIAGKKIKIPIME
tara:strand:+ start:1044 stop:1334 length:291 start_codon:yes stop_codon:yes gene_type:complete